MAMNPITTNETKLTPARGFCRNTILNTLVTFFERELGMRVERVIDDKNLAVVVPTTDHGDQIVKMSFAASNMKTTGPDGKQVDGSVEDVMGDLVEKYDLFVMEQARKAEEAAITKELKEKKKRESQEKAAQERLRAKEAAQAAAETNEKAETEEYVEEAV